MTTKFTVRIQSERKYEFWEAETDSFEELVEAEELLRDHAGNGGPRNDDSDEAQQKAIGALQRGGLVKKLPGLGQRKQESDGGGGRWQSKGQEFEEEELGKLDDGTIITLHEKGKYGPYVKAYIPSTKDKVFANLPKGLLPSKVDLATAIELLEEKMAG